MTGLVSIPTRDRAEILLPGLRAWEEGLSACDPGVEFLVSDASRDGGDALARALGEYGFAKRVHHVGRTLRREFALELGRAVGEDPSFALGLDEGPEGYGANRNTILLLCAGRRFSFLDDDVRPEFRRIGNADREWLESDAADPTSLHPYRSIDALDCLSSPVRGPARELYAHPWASLEALPGGGPKPAAINFGTWGDMGMPDARYLLTGRFNVGPAVYEDEDAYEAALVGREVFRSVEAPLVGGLFFMPMHCLVDGRSVLPPFSPVGRGEDLLWGVSLRILHPDRPMAYSPWAVHHCPPSRPAGTRGEVRAWPQRINDLLRFHLGSLLEAASGYQCLGQALLEPSRSRNTDLLSFYASLVEGSGRARIRGLESVYDAFDGLPSAWSVDMKASLENVVAELSRKPPALPRELPSLEALRDYLGRFGRLLQAWPELWQAASRLAPEFLERSRLRA